MAAAFVYAAVAIAADLQEDTRRAFDGYAEQATRVFLEHVRGARSATDGTASRAAAASRNGEVVARPAHEDGIVSVPGGLVHHWVGSTFIAGVTLRDALDVSSVTTTIPLSISGSSPPRCSATRGTHTGC